MSLREINYNINTDGISPGVEQFAGTQGDHRVTRLNFVFSDKFHQEIDELGAEGDKVMYRFDVYDGEGGIWSSEPKELEGYTLSMELEERHTRHGGKVTIYLVLTVLSSDCETEIELYSFPAVLRLKNRPEGTYQDGENYESVTSLAEMAKSNALAAEETNNELQSLAADVEEKLKNGEFDGVGVETAVIINDELIIRYTDGTVQNLGNVKGDKGPQGEKGDKGDAGKDAVTDQTYNAESENAQSGKAVAEAIANTAVLKTQLAFTAQARKVPQYNDGRRIQTDTPVNSQDCVNKQYIDNNYYTKDEVDNLEAVKSISFKDYDGTDYTEIKDPYGTVVLALSDQESTVDVKDCWLTNVRYPVDSTDAATKGYVGDAVANAVGSVDLSNYYTKDEVNNLACVKNTYEEAEYFSINSPNQDQYIDLYNVGDMDINANGHNININGAKIIYVATPKDDTDAATKGYVDDAVANAIASSADLNYELIEEITVTEDVNEILKTTSPDGTPYNFKGVTIEFSSEGVTGYSGKQLIEFNDGRVFKGSAEFLSDNRISSIRGIYCNGLTFYDATWNAPSANSNTINQNGYACAPKAIQENVTKIHIRSAVKAGTVIKIYGIKV